MRLIDRFKQAVRAAQEQPGGRVLPALEGDDGSGPVAGIRGLYNDDVAFIAGAMQRTKWAKPDPPSDANVIASLRAEVKTLRAKVAELERSLYERRR